MAIYTPQEATLGNVEGRGYVFNSGGFPEETQCGVFFADEESTEELEALLEADEVRFEGVAYRTLKSGKIKKKIQDFVVDVKNLITVHAGERVDFVVTEEA